MGRIPDDVIARVIEAHDIVAVIERHVPLKRAGSAFKGLCPFHDEKTPSFTVNPSRQSFKCFGCGKGGTVITFVMLHLRMSFPEALRMLAQERGIAVPDSREPAGPPKGELEACLRALAFAQELFTRSLAAEEGAEARRYLEARGFPAEAQERFGLGYAPAGWDRLITSAAGRKIDTATLEMAGLVVPRSSGSGHYDRFRHRITFPVRNLLGQVVTFGARALAPEDMPKYLNGPETPVFRKGATLFALDMARDGTRRRGEALLMEGYTDVLMAHRFGFDAAVAGMGTAFTPQQATLLRRFVPRVVLVYDGDAAGRAAAEKAIDLLLAEGLEVKVALLPEGRDVDEILLEEGAAAFQAVLDQSLGVLDYLLAALRARLDLASPHGRAQAAEALVKTVARVKSHVERDFMLRTLVERLGGGVETERLLRRMLGEAAAAPGATARAPAPAPAAADASFQQRHQRLDELLLLAVACAGGALAERVVRAVGTDDFSPGVRRRLYATLLAQREAQAAHDVAALTVQVADDPEACAELADLPQGAGLDERAGLLIEHLERRRRHQRRLEAAQQARQADDPQGPLGEILSAHPGRGTPTPALPPAAPAAPFPAAPPAAPESSG
ncbi:MAG: DNA primase [Planctomycetia bacterium]